MKSIQLCIMFLVILSSSTSFAAEKNEELAKEIEKAAAALEKQMPDDWMFDVKTAQLDEYSIKSWRTKRLDEHFESTDLIDSYIEVYLGVKKEDSISIGLHKNASSPNRVGAFLTSANDKVPSVEVLDNNSDGKFDAITYYVKDENGSEIKYVTDYDMDGQADIRVTFVGPDMGVEMWHLKGWHHVTKTEQKYYIVVDSNQLEVIKDGIEYKVK